jgi:DNA-binding Lrp family transcriptional regulator
MTMIKVQCGQERSAYDYLQKKPEVRDIYRLFGEYDFFLVLQADGKKGLAQMIREINEEQSVIKTAPVLFTTDGDSDDKSILESARVLT